MYIGPIHNVRTKGCLAIYTRPYTYFNPLLVKVANCASVFNMLGAYGDVVCVKILRNKRDCALVQMAKPHHAQQVNKQTEKSSTHIVSNNGTPCSA